jgi:hypothetical protein
MKDERLEILSDLVRSGVPVDFSQAIEVIEYQERLKATRKITRLEKIKNYFRKIYHEQT